MRLLRTAVIAIAVAACASTGWESAATIAAGFGNKCGGVKPETRKACWRDLF